MSRGQPRDSRAPGPPAGPRWSAFRRELFARWSASGTRPVLCWACGHPVPGPDGGEVQHVISWRVRPDLAWTRSNLRPIHGGGRKRCPDPSCGLACNAVAAGQPAQGQPVPWSAEFIAAARARTEDGRRSGTGRDRKAPLTVLKPAVSARKSPETGRAWLAPRVAIRQPSGTRLNTFSNPRDHLA
jgi:hypothetical protein